jgi:hypothetical protein
MEHRGAVPQAKVKAILLCKIGLRRQAKYSGCPRGRPMGIARELRYVGARMPGPCACDLGMVGRAVARDEKAGGQA